MINIEKNKSLYIVFMALLGGIAPVSTDMYLAAIPQIADGWGVGKNLVNLTLVLWFVSYSFCILVAGSLSDKYGRKPILLGGLAFFVVASILCAMSSDVYQLIVFRIMQGAGAGAPSAIVMAIIRDKFQGSERHRVLAYIMTIVAVAPMVAPMVGAMMLKYFSWRYIFFVQAFIVVLALLIAFSFKETIAEKLNTRIIKLVTRYGVHVKNRRFMMANFSLGLLALPLYGFIAFSPLYYISINNLSEQTFSIFFGANAFCAMLGSFTSSKIAKKVSDDKIVLYSLLGCLTGGAGVLLFAGVHYIIFFCSMAIFTFFLAMNRPLSGSIIIGLVDTDIGSASSLMVSSQFLCGALCMALVTHQWESPSLVFGTVIFMTSALVLSVWLRIAKSVISSAS